MKVLWLSHLIPFPPKAGVLQRSYHLVRELAKHHEVHVLAFNQTNLLEPYFSSLEQGISEAESHLLSYCKTFQHMDIPKLSKPFGKQVTALRSLFSATPYNISWLKSKQFKLAVQQVVTNTSFDVAVLDTISLVPYFNDIGNIPIIIDHHNIESHMLLRRASKEPNIIKRLFYLQEGHKLKRFEIEYCAKAADNITCSAVDSIRLRSLHPSICATDIPNGVDLGNTSAVSNPQPHSKSLIFVGTLDWYPNREAVLFIKNNLWPELKVKMPDIKIDIIGSNPPKELVNFSKTETNFNVHGYVDDLQPFMNSAAVYVCPIMDGGGTKLKVLDAMAAGKALVAHPLACEGIDVEDGVNVILAKTSEEFVSGILSIIEDVPKREALASAARTLIEQKYSYTSIGRKLANVVENVAKNEH